jgi:hypothetical protein
MGCFCSVFVSTNMKLLRSLRDNSGCIFFYKYKTATQFAGYFGVYSFLQI